VDLAEMNYTLEGGYFDRFPYAPYVPPGTVRPASHNDRRVLGRRGDQLISVTDLPAHFLHPSESPDYAYTGQNFEFAGDFTTWILETCRRTRFTPAAASLPDSDRLTVAVTATKTGLAWDLTGNVVIVDRRSWQAPPPSNRQLCPARHQSRRQGMGADRDKHRSPTAQGPRRDPHSAESQPA